MMRKLSKYLTVCCACVSLSISVHAATEIVVYYTEGEEHLEFHGLLEEKPVLNFTETGVEIESPSMRTSLPNTNYLSIDSIAFHEVDVTGISIPMVPQQGLSFQYTDGSTVLIGGLTSDQQVAVLTLDGRQVSAHTTRNGSTVSIDLSPLSRGYYIINVGKQSFKVFKK